VSLLEICQHVADNIGIDRPSMIVGNNQPSARRLLEQARRTGREIAERANWVALVQEHVFTADGTSVYTLPADFRSMINDTLWDRTRYWQMRGALSPQQWQMYKSSIIGRASIERRWRLRVPGAPDPFILDQSLLGSQTPYQSSITSGDYVGDEVKFQIDPSIVADITSTFVFEYVSKNWVRSQTLKRAKFGDIGSSAGSGYSVGEFLTVLGGSFTEQLQLKVTVVDASGGILAAEIVGSGGVYSVVPANPVSAVTAGGGGTGFGGVLGDEEGGVLGDEEGGVLGDEAGGSSGNGSGALFMIYWAWLTQDDWHADTDVSLLSEDLIELGVLWRTLGRLGMAYAEEKDDYDRDVDRAVARDGGTATLWLATYPRGYLVSPANIQEGNFPGA